MFDMQHVYAVAAMALVFVPLELALPARKRPKFSAARYTTDILHVAIGGYVIRLGTVVLLATLVPGNTGPAWIPTLPLWAQFIGVLLISDFMFWIAHRLYHAVPLLWRFHRIHHSSEHLDWLATFRVHPVDQIINATIIALPTLLLGFSPVALLLFGLIYKWHAILLHSNLRIGLGPLGKIIITPDFHHWHHANQVEAYDKNFGGQLTIWDRLFGTYYRGLQSRPNRYGVENPPRETFLTHILEPFSPGKRHG